MHTIIIEIRAAEGGDDSKLFTEELAQTYLRYAERKGWKGKVIEAFPSKIGLNQINLEIRSQDNAILRLLQEAGGHRVQRVPPTEKRGRIHTSTVTVAVFCRSQASVNRSPADAEYPESDFKTEWFRGSGAGGQHRNKHANSCRLVHLPTGKRREAQCRSRQNSYNNARRALIADLDADRNWQQHASENQRRRQQVGTGMRADKIRTYRFQDDRVTCHRTGLTASVSRVMGGDLDKLIEG